MKRIDPLQRGRRGNAGRKEAKPFMHNINSAYVHILASIYS